MTSGIDDPNRARDTQQIEGSVVYGPSIGEKLDMAKGEKRKARERDRHLFRYMYMGGCALIRVCWGED